MPATAHTGRHSAWVVPVVLKRAKEEAVYDCYDGDLNDDGDDYDDDDDDG